MTVIKPTPNPNNSSLITLPAQDPLYLIFIGILSYLKLIVKNLPIILCKLTQNLFNLLVDIPTSNTHFFNLSITFLIIKYLKEFLFFLIKVNT